MKNLLALVMAATFGASAFADTVVPVSYTFDQATSVGDWAYHDPSYTKLTDGILGKAGWAVNQGQDWNGWAYKPTINIDFNFGSAKTISSISIGSTQDNLFDVALPSFAIYALEGSNWVSKGSIINLPSPANDHSHLDNGPHLFYTLDSLSINSQFVRVTVISNGPWTFVDEVRFQSPVPEPETYAMLLSGLGLLMLKKRARRAA